ncbi:hypothetical protein D3C83_202730 [compost metagenome]
MSREVETAHEGHVRGQLLAHVRHHALERLPDLEMSGDLAPDVEEQQGVAFHGSSSK